MSDSGKLVVGEALLSLTPTSAAAAFHGGPRPDTPKAIPKSSMKVTEFLFGASVYPELQTRAEWNDMLDHFQRAHMNCVRVTESSWGNIETASGKYDFAWVRDFLDDLEKRKMKAFLGTGSYVPPQWLAAGNPDILVELHPGVKAHPMARHAPCLNHPLYRQALRQYILAIGKEFKDHPVVIGWQLGNELEFNVPRICYNAACQAAWRQWLKTTYRTPDEFNRRLYLVSWGMKVRSLDEVAQPGEGVEESGAYIAALTLAHRHFGRDVLLGFYAMQAEALREAGVQQWIMTDYNDVWDAVADEPQACRTMDIAGLNYYQPSTDDPEYWRNLTWHQDMHRSAHGKQYFITTENHYGAVGSTYMWAASSDSGGAYTGPSVLAPIKEQFQMWGWEAAALGSSGVLYWTGNRWRGGHWPQCGGLLDWSGHPEPDFDWAVELGESFRKWEKVLIQNPVKATAAALTDFSQRVALEIYPHIKPSRSVLPQTFEALHRLGIGVDSMNLAAAENPSNLAKYSLMMIPAATALDNARVTAALKTFTEGGGVVVITPFTAYSDENGIFRADGFAANLQVLTGGLVRTIRWMGPAGTSGRNAPQVEWQGRGMTGTSPVGLDGYCEFLEVGPEADVLARFRSDQAILDGRPAATKRSLGRGVVVKLGFWPGDDSLMSLIRHFVPDSEGALSAPVPAGVLAVPRSDDSLFVVNTTSREMAIVLRRAVQDRLSAAKLSGKALLKAFQVLWLE
ncbi:MAG: beta-galactosidase [Terriglobia bacterium]